MFRTNQLLERILNKLDQIYKVLSIEGRQYEAFFEPAWFDLPDHLKKTVMALAKLDGEATADEIAMITKRARAVESGYLNQLALAGKIEKPPRRGRRQYFTWKGKK